jgi:hypothetical protein
MKQQRVETKQEATRKLEEKRDSLLEQQNVLSLQINKHWNCTTWRALNVVNYKLEVIEKRLSGRFVDPQADYQTIEELSV